MNIRNHRTRSMFLGAIVIIMLACNTPSVTVDLGSGVTSTVPTAVLHPPITQLAPTVQIPTNITVQIPAATLTLAPTNLPTSIISFTPTYTLTPITPLPNFDPIVDFGGGGGAGICGFVDSEPNAIQVASQYGLYLGLCFYLRGMKNYQPFQVSLNQIGGARMSLESPNLRFDQMKKVISWDGYAKQSGSANWTSDGVLSALNFTLWWPAYLPAGQWKITISQNNSSFGKFSTDFQIEKEHRPYLSALGSRPRDEIVPSYFYPFTHSLIPKDNGRADFIGQGFPPNAPIYILLYRKEFSGYKLQLMDTLMVMTDASGSLASELPDFLEVGSTYLLAGVSDPNANTGLGGKENSFDTRLPYDYFVAESITHASYSCPSAPPQRMIVNQRGYVCTKNDTVRLRGQPSRSSNTLMEIGPGTNFTVIGGPVCADNWSWWNVRLENGATGWVSEGGDEIDPYFICPLK